LPFFIAGFVILVVLIAAGHAFVNADPQKLTRFFRLFLLSLGAAVAGAVLLLLLFSERLGSAMALVGILGPALYRGRGMLRRWQSAAGPSPRNVSEVETDYLRMRLDHDTGSMSGTVRHGRFAGRRLEELAEPDLIEFWRDCRIGDEASARLMESYLDRLRPNCSRATSDTMTREEALAILGLKPGADAAAVKKAHRELMMKLHPDQGGSTYLATKINRAKEVLLG
jgi:DnaJ domain